MPIRIQRELSARNVLRKALEWLSTPEHFTTGKLFRSSDNYSGAAVTNAGRTCALGAIRKAYYELDPEHDASKISDIEYSDVPQEILDADVLLARCLTGAEVTDPAEAHAKIVNVNDSYGDDGYGRIVDGLECAVQKASA